MIFFTYNTFQPPYIFLYFWGRKKKEKITVARICHGDFDCDTARRYTEQAETKDVKYDFKCLQIDCFAELCNNNTWESVGNVTSFLRGKTHSKTNNLLTLLLLIISQIYFWFNCI